MTPEWTAFPDAPAQSQNANREFERALTDDRLAHGQPLIKSGARHPGFKYEVFFLRRGLRHCSATTAVT